MLAEITIVTFIRMKTYSIFVLPPLTKIIITEKLLTKVFVNVYLKVTNVIKFLSICCSPPFAVHLHLLVIINICYFTFCLLMNKLYDKFN